MPTDPNPATGQPLPHATDSFDQVFASLQARALACGYSLDPADIEDEDDDDEDWDDEDERDEDWDEDALDDPDELDALPHLAGPTLTLSAKQSPTPPSSPTFSTPALPITHHEIAKQTPTSPSSSSSTPSPYSHTTFSAEQTSTSPSSHLFGQSATDTALNNDSLPSPVLGEGPRGRTARRLREVGQCGPDAKEGVRAHTEIAEQTPNSPTSPSSASPTWIGTTHAKRLLGVGCEKTVIGWVRYGYLRARVLPNRRTQLLREDVLRLAHQLSHPRHPTPLPGPNAPPR